MKNTTQQSYLTKNIRRKLICFVAFAVASVCNTTLALDTIDPDFSPTIHGPGTVRDLLWSSDNYLYLSVSADKVNGQSVSTSLLRMTPTEGWDESFLPAVDGSISVLHRQSDGKILVAGSFTSVGGHPSRNVARLNSDGTIDEMFTATSSSFAGSILSIASQQDGSVLVGMRGQSQEQWVDGHWFLVPAVTLIRLHSDGAKDEAFAPSFEQEEQSSWWRGDLRVNTLAVQSDGKILVGGNFFKVNGVIQPYLARLNTDGTLDEAYRPILTHGSDIYYSPSDSGMEVRSIAFTNGNAVVGGTFSGVDGYYQPAVAKLLTNGQLDLSFRVFFNSWSSWQNAVVSNIQVDSLGRLILIGEWESIEGASGWNRAARVDEYGRLDSDFVAPFGNQDRCIVISDDQVVFGRTGSLSSNFVIQEALAGYFEDGSKDPAFNLDLRRQNRPNFLVTRPGTGPIIGGTWIKDVNDEDYTGLTGLTSTGENDSNFNVTLTPAASARSLLRLPDGRFLIGGGFSQCNGVLRPRLAMINPDGSTDELFDLGSGPDSTIDLIRMMPTGKVLVAGNFNRINGLAAKGLALLDLTKLDDNSSVSVLSILEARYGTSTTYADVTSLLQSMLAEGSLSVTASNSAMGGDPAPGQSKTLTVRYLTQAGERTGSVSEGQALSLPNKPWDSGLISPEFRPANTETLSLTDAVGTPDGKIILVGSFSTFAGKPFRRMVRLHSDGTVDESFMPESDFSSFNPRVTDVDAEGKIYIGGFSLRRTGATSSLGVHRLLSSGLPDDSFTCPLFISSTEDLLALNDGRLFVTGSFSSSTTGNKRRVARLLNSGGVDPSFDAGDSANSTVNRVALVTPSKLYLTGSFSSFQGIPSHGISLLNLQEPLPSQARLIVTDNSKENEPQSFWVHGLGEEEFTRWYFNEQLVQEGGHSITFNPINMFDAGNYTLSVTNPAGVVTSSVEVDIEELSFSEWANLHNLSGSPLADYDGDGHSDMAEYIARTDPTNASSFLIQDISLGTDSVNLSWPTFPGRIYSVFSSVDMIEWHQMGDPITGDGSTHDIEVSLPEVPANEFYRLNVSKP